MSPPVTNPTRPAGFLTTQQAGQLLGVHARTIVRWSKEGRLPHHRTLGGHRRFAESELLALRDTHTSEVTS